MGGLYREIELPLIAVLAEMESAGIRVDIYRLAEIAAKLGDQVDELEERAYELAGGPFTLGSPKQLGEILFERLGLPADRKGKTGYSTDARVLAKIRDIHPIVAVIEAWREQSKLLNTYVQPLPGLVDPHATAGCTPPSARRLRPPAGCRRSGRTSRTSRSEQPLGREIRGAFVAEEGARLLSADYSQVELRILAHLSDEPALKDAFARGEDIHRVTAAEVLGKPAEDAHARGAKPRQGRQLRNHLRHQRVWPVGAALDLSRRSSGLHRHLSGAVPTRVMSSSAARSHRPRSLATSAPCSGAAARFPSCARPAIRPAAWANGWRSTPSCRGRLRTSSRWP